MATNAPKGWSPEKCILYINNTIDRFNSSSSGASEELVTRFNETHHRAMAVQIKRLPGHLRANIRQRMSVEEQDLHETHNAILRHKIERLNKIAVNPPRRWSNEKCLDYVQELAVQAKQCNKANIRTMVKFSHTWMWVRSLCTVRIQIERKARTQAS